MQMISGIRLVSVMLFSMSLHGMTERPGPYTKCDRCCDCIGAISAAGCAYSWFTMTGDAYYDLNTGGWEADQHSIGRAVTLCVPTAGLLCFSAMCAKKALSRHHQQQD